MTTSPCDTPSHQARDAICLGLLLAASLGLRLYVIDNGGAGFFQDEQRFLTAVSLVNSQPNVNEVLRHLFIAGVEHKLFTLCSGLLAAAYGLFPASTLSPVYFFALFSTVNIALVYAIARTLTASPGEALLAALLMACANSNLYWARHLVPYDLALCFGLASILLACREKPGLVTAFFCGLLSACCFWTYNGYFLTAAIGPSLFFLLRLTREGPRRTIRLTLPLCLGCAALFAFLWLTTAHYANDPAYNIFADLRNFSKSVNQGDFNEGHLFPWLYFADADPGVLAVWAILCPLSLVLALTGKVPGASRRVAVAGGTAAALLLLLFLFSNVLEKTVVYGRTARQLLPFLCLLAAVSANWIGQAAKGWARPAVFALILLAAAPSLYATATLIFPKKMAADALALSKDFGGQDGIYLVSLGDHLLAPFDASACGPPQLIRSSRNPNDFTPYFFEGGGARERREKMDRLRQHPPLPIALFRISCPVTEAVVKHYYATMGTYKAFTLGISMNYLRQRLDDLETIRQALEEHRRVTGAYPVSPSLTGLYTAGSSRENDWLPGLAPNFLRALPRDPRRDLNPSHQYMYASNGADYKLIVHHPEDCEAVKKLHPDMIDPARPPCFAYGYWTKKAAAW